MMIGSEASQIAVLSLSASEPSVGRYCLPTIEDALRIAGAYPITFDIRELPPIWVDKRELQEFPSAYVSLYSAVQEADGVILIVPVHCYTSSGAAKAVTEVIGDALTRKPVGIITAAGSHRSHLAARDLMASMMFEQETLCYPGTVQATDAMLKGTEPDAELQRRLVKFCSKFVAYTSALRPFINQFGTESGDAD